LTLQSRRAQLADPGAELLDRAQALWSSYGRYILGAAVAVAVVAVLGFFMVRSRATAEANLLFWQGQYDRSIDEAKQVAQQFPSTRAGNDAHRLIGDDAYWNGILRSQSADYKTAITEYRVYLAHEKNGVLANSARRSLAYALENDKQYAEAAKQYEQLVGAFDRESSGEFLMGAARCYQSLGRRDDALARLQRVIDEFGDTSSAVAARVRIAEIKAAAS